MEKLIDLKNWDIDLYYCILLFLNYVEINLRVVVWKENWYIIFSIWSFELVVFELKGGYYLLLRVFKEK